MASMSLIQLSFLSSVMLTNDSTNIRKNMANVFLISILVSILVIGFVHGQGPFTDPQSQSMWLSKKCTQYGHSCLGGHGKRSTSVEGDSATLSLNQNNNLAQLLSELNIPKQRKPLSIPLLLHSPSIVKQSLFHPTQSPLLINAQNYNGPEFRQTINPFIVQRLPNNWPKSSAADNKNAIIQSVPATSFGQFDLKELSDRVSFINRLRENRLNSMFLK